MGPNGPLTDTAFRLGEGDEQGGPYNPTAFRGTTDAGGWFVQRAGSPPDTLWYLVEFTNGAPPDGSLATLSYGNDGGTRNHCTQTRRVVGRSAAIPPSSICPPDDE